MVYSSGAWGLSAWGQGGCLQGASAPFQLFYVSVWTHNFKWKVSGLQFVASYAGREMFRGAAEYKLNTYTPDGT